MKPIFLLYGIMLIILLASIYQISINYPFKTTSNQNSTNQVCFQENCFNVELAITEQQKILGLQSRESLENDSGMLFLFTAPGIYSFWMKDTLIPLDIIWLDENKKIVFIKENALPCQTTQCESFSPEENAKYVLEINAFSSSLNNLSIGTQAKFK